MMWTWPRSATPGDWLIFSPVLSVLVGGGPGYTPPTPTTTLGHRDGSGIVAAGGHRSGPIGDGAGHRDGSGIVRSTGKRSW